MELTRSRRGIAVAAIAAAALAVAGCSSSGGAKATQTAAAAGGAANVGAKAYTIAVITHQNPGDTFWDKVQSGANSAGKNHGITINYAADPSVAGQSTLIQNAIDRKVDGIATTLPSPDALKPVVQAAVAAGIPVIALNAGFDAYQDMGALMYFGSDEKLAGEAAGARATAAGAKHVLCVIQEAGNISLETRCAGVATGAPGTQNVQVNGTDMSSVTSTLTAKLQQDPSIDFVITLGAGIALGAVEAKSQAKSSAKIGTFDLSPETVKAVQDGSLDFSIDQQPYLQGYEAVDSLWLYLENGNELGGGKPVLTGPSFIDKTNIANIAKYAAAGTR